MSSIPAQNGGSPLLSAMNVDGLWLPVFLRQKFWDRGMKRGDTFYSCQDMPSPQLTGKAADGPTSLSRRLNKSMNIRWVEL